MKAKKAANKKKQVSFAPIPLQNKEDPAEVALSESESGAEEDPAEVEFDIDAQPDLDPDAQIYEFVGGDESSIIDAEEDLPYIEETVLRERQDEIYVVPREQNITSSLMTKYEFTETITIRATTIALGGKCFAQTKHTDPIEMTKDEITQRVCPLTLRRRVGTITEGSVTTVVYEYWDVRNMRYPVI